MANEPVDLAATVARLSQPQLGPDPAAQQAAVGQAPTQVAPVQLQTQPTEKATPEEAAVAQGSPRDEADAMGADAILYEIGGRKLTPSQISSTFDRYRDLNFKNQENANLMRVAEAAMKSGRAKSPDDVARMLLNMLRAEEPNAQMGGQDERPNEVKQTSDDDLTKWEQDNAASLPPGYRDLHKSLGSMGAGMNELKAMLAQVLQASAQNAGQATQNLSQAREERNATIQAKIANNLETMAGKLGLTGDDSGDFMIFAGERGYTLDDFIDPQLAGRVMQDFQANKQSPEMERLRNIHSRRQAFTGTMAAAPSAQGQSPAAAEGGDPDLARLASNFQARR